MREMKLQDLKSKTPPELVAFAEEHQVENASTLRKQELMFAILKQLASQEVDIIGEGVVEVLSDGFGFLRSPESNYLSGPDDIYVSPSQIRRFGLRTGDTIEGHIRSPKEGERYFALLKVNTLNFEDPEKAKHKVNFDNLTPLFPNQRFRMEIDGLLESHRRLAQVSTALQLNAPEIQCLGVIASQGSHIVIQLLGTKDLLFEPAGGHFFRRCVRALRG